MEAKTRLEANAGASMQEMLGLVMGVLIVGIVAILSFVLSAKVYNLSEPDINAINNTEIKNAVQQGSVDTIKATTSIGSYMGLIILVVVIGVVLKVIFSSFTGAPAGGFYNGGYL